MDKVIIDGVDVSGCKHYKIGTCVADYLLTDMNFSEAKCKLCPDCYYKQLKRKEQECEKLKWLLETKCQSELEKENERLKEEIKYLEEEKKEKIQLLEQIINILYPNASDDELFTVTFNSEYIDKLKNYHQALQEIREITKEQLQDVSDRCINTTPMYIVHKHIIAKINEVIGAE